jgi:hypothetical protein
MSITSLLQSITNFCRAEPVRVMALVNGIIVVAVSFGAHLTTQQIASVTGLAAIVLGVGGELVRYNVTPYPPPIVVPPVVPPVVKP